MFKTKRPRGHKLVQCYIICVFNWNPVGAAGDADGVFRALCCNRSNPDGAAEETQRLVVPRHSAGFLLHRSGFSGRNRECPRFAI